MKRQEQGNRAQNGRCSGARSTALVLGSQHHTMEGMGLEMSWERALQVILMAGLQGVGKTTACGKLALALQKRNKRVLMVATDVYRPAAIDQLVKLGERIKVSYRVHGL